MFDGSATATPAVLNQMDHDATGLDPRVFGAVGLVVATSPLNGEDYVGTGTLIAPGIVLTAAHVVQTQERLYTNVRFFPGGMRAREVSGMQTLANTDFGREIKAATGGVIPFGSKADQRAETDLALIKLERVPIGIPMMAISFASPNVGQQMTVVGFGESTRVGTNPGSVQDASLRDPPGQYEHFGTTSGLFFPGGYDNGTVVGTQFLPGTSITDHGDSGGPMILRRPFTVNTWTGPMTTYRNELVAVTSAIDTRWVHTVVGQNVEPVWGSVSIGTRVDHWADYIEYKVFQLTGTHVDPNKRTIYYGFGNSPSLNGDLRGYGLETDAINHEAFSGTVASFVDAGALVSGASNSYDAQINWGDGDVTAGEVWTDGSGLFYVRGDHEFQSEGTWSIDVMISDSSGGFTHVYSPLTVRARSVAASSGMPLSTVSDRAIRAAVLATFTDPNGPGPVWSYSADIDWGDGAGVQVDAGSIGFNGEQFEVHGGYEYDYPANTFRSGPTTYNISVTIHRGTAQPQTVHTTATVYPAVRTSRITTQSGEPLNTGSTIFHEVTSIVVGFSTEMCETATTSANSATNPVNYQLVNEVTGLTHELAEVDYALNPVSGRAEARLTLAQPLRAGSYQLVVRGTVESRYGHQLNHGEGLTVPFRMADLIGVGDEVHVGSVLVESPSVAIDCSGNYVVAWSTPGVAPEDGVRIQRFDAHGNRLGAETMVSQAVTGTQSYPQVAMDSAGNFVVVWTVSGAVVNGIFARRFNSDGTPQGDDTLVHSDEINDSDNYGASVAMNASGEYVIVWSEFRPDVGAWGIYGRHFVADPAIAPGEEFQANVDLNMAPGCPKVAMDAFGNFVIAWSGTGRMLGPRGELSVVRGAVVARWFDSNGSPAAPPITVGTTGGTDSAPSSVAIDRNGGFVVAWYCFETGGSRVLGRRFSDFGVNGSDLFEVAFTQSSYGSSPAAAVAADGNVTIVWQDRRAHEVESIYLAQFDAMNSRRTDNLRLEWSGAREQRSPIIAMAPNGDSVVAWTRWLDDCEVIVQRIVTARSQVAGRWMFYNSSTFDGNNAAANNQDDLAIAIDKVAYLPGNGTANFASVSSYSRGINGIMIDLAGAGNHSAINADDFVFRVGNNNAPVTWSAAPTPTSIVVRAGAGVGGSDRIEITWANNAIRNQWLEVNVLAGASTGLESNDVFYWGSRVGDTGFGTPAGAFVTSAADKTTVIGHFGANAPLTDLLDFNRDGAVTGADATIATSSFGSITRLNIQAVAAIGGNQAMNASATDFDACATACAVNQTTASSTSSFTTNPLLNSSTGALTGNIGLDGVSQKAGAAVVDMPNASKVVFEGFDLLQFDEVDFDEELLGMLSATAIAK